MKYTLSLFLFFVATLPVVGQIPGAVQIGQNVSKEELDKAIKVVNAAKASDFTWKVGQFQIFQKGDKAKGKLYWDVSDETILTVEEVPSSTQFWYDGFRADTAASQRWKFPPQAESYWVFNAVKEGTTRISIFGVSADGKEVVLVAKMSVTVGNAPPKPVDPINPTDALVAAALADIKTGKGTAEDIEAYASIYNLFSVQVKNGNTLVTVGDLYKEMNTSIDRLLGEDIDKTLPTLRRAVGAELRAKIPTNAGAKIADNRAVISEEFASIAKRLQGVK